MSVKKNINEGFDLLSSYISKNNGRPLIPLSRQSVFKDNLKALLKSCRCIPAYGLVRIFDLVISDGRITEMGQIPSGQ